MELQKIKDLIKKKRPHLTQNTLKSYGYNVIRVKKLVKSFDADKIARALSKEKIKPSIGRSLVNAVIVYQKAKGIKTAKLDELKARLDTEFLDTAKLQKKTDKDIKRWLTAKDIDNVVKGIKAEVKRLNLWGRSSLRPKEKQLLQMHFIIEFYRQNRIRNELATTVVMPVGQYKILKQRDKNYLVLSHKTAEIHLYDFKTKRSWERRGLLPRIFPLSKTQNLLLRRWLQHKPKGENLFWRQNGTPLVGSKGRDTLSRWLSAVFFKFTGKYVGSNMLRKIYISSLLEGAPSLTTLLDAKQKLGHSIETMQTYRRS